MLPEAGKWTEQLDGVASGLTGALDELHEIARGIHPAARADGGLRPALKTLARRSAVPVRLDLGVERRLPEPIELAAYYVVSRHSPTPPSMPTPPSPMRFPRDRGGISYEE
jgi:signal transduction histidine kinase